MHRSFGGLRVAGSMLLVALCLIAFWRLAGCKKPQEQAISASGSRSNSFPVSTHTNTAATNQAPPQKAEFSITSPKPETKLEAGNRISVSGEYSSKDTHIWLFLIDIYAGYYLQNPAVQLLANGQWEQNNVIPGKGIQCIVAVKVNEEGQRGILGWAEKSRWGRIPPEEVQSLPGYEEVARVKVITPSPD